MIRLLIRISTDINRIEARMSSKVGFSTCIMTVVVVTGAAVIVDEIVCTEDTVPVKISV
jgi:hypothetical protein